MVSSSAALESGIRNFHVADANGKFVQRADQCFIWGSVCSLIISMAFWNKSVYRIITWMLHYFSSILDHLSFKPHKLTVAHHFLCSPFHHWTCIFQHHFMYVVVVMLPFLLINHDAYLMILIGQSITSWFHFMPQYHYLIIVLYCIV